MTDQEIIALAEEATRNLSQAIIYAAQLAKDTPEPKSIAEMFGEFLRDAAVLILIFVPIDILWPEISKGQPLDRQVIEWTIGLSLGALLAGMLIERWKDL